MAPKAEAADVLVLPSTVVSRLDISHLSRELEVVGDRLEQYNLRKDKNTEDLPRVSVGLMEISKANKLELRDKADRQRLDEFLKELKKEAPSIHMSFAAEAPPVFLHKIIEWLRKEIHPLILLEVGLQPSIAAGCVIRTTNKYIDCSVGQNLRKSRASLIELMGKTS